MIFSQPSFRLLPISGLAALVVAALLFTAGCDFFGDEYDDDTSELEEGIAKLRRATARYHRVEVAIEDGYVEDPLGLVCVDPPGPGAVGVPYVRPDRVSDTDIILEEPEVLFYEPQKNGKLRLVGSEPVVPIALWDETHDEPPSLLGHEFHRNEEHGLYGLHFWQWRHNPDGIIAFANPRVSCEFAE